MTVKQLDIHWIDLEPTRGAETKKKRPCVILQSDIVNSGSWTVIVAPLLPDHKDWPFAVNIAPKRSNGLDKNRHINIKQLRAVDVSRIQGKVGALDRGYLPEIEAAIRVVFGL